MSENCSPGSRPLLISVPHELEFLRPDLQRFFDAMIYKLRRNKHKGRWEDLDIPKTVERMRDEIAELEEAISEGSTVEVLFEAADVANFALITANISLEARDVIQPQSSHPVVRSSVADRPEVPDAECS